MLVVCSWCDEALHFKRPFDDERTTHGMCSECAVEATRQAMEYGMDQTGVTFDHHPLMCNSPSVLKQAS